VVRGEQSEAECGKTTLLALISLMVPRGITIVEASPAVLYLEK